MADWLSGYKAMVSMVEETKPSMVVETWPTFHFCLQTKLLDTSQGRRRKMNGRIVIVILINIYTELLDFPVCFHFHCKKKVLHSKTACCCWHMEFYSTREMTLNRMYAWFWVDRSVLMNAWRADFCDTHRTYLPSSYDVTILYNF